MNIKSINLYSNPAFSKKNNVENNSIAKFSLNKDLYVSKSSNLTFCATPSFKVVDMQTWPGKEVYDMFSHSKNSFVAITTDVDVKNLVKLAKEKKTTVNTLVMFAIGKAVNSVSQFRLRMVDNKLVEFDKSCMSVPVPAEGKPGFFNFSDYFEFDPKLDNFIKNARTAIDESKKRKGMFPTAPREDSVFLSHIKNNYKALNNPNNGKDDLFPRINWGKPEKKPGATVFNKGKMLMPLTIDVNHSVISGSHIEKFLEVFQETCNKDLKPQSLKDKISRILAIHGNEKIKNN